MLPVLVSDEPGIDWRQFYLDQMKNLQWTPAEIGALTLPQIFALWGGEQADVEPAPETNGRPHKKSRADHLQMINDLRARFGKPPVEPQGWTPGVDPEADWLRLEEE